GADTGQLSRSPPDPPVMVTALGRRRPGYSGTGGIGGSMSGIRPDHRTVVVFTALELEYQAVRGYLAEPGLRPHPAGTLFEVGALPGTPWQVALSIVGEGNQAAAVLAERAIAMFQPAMLLFVGVAGALLSDIELGDVVVATRVYGYHGGKAEGGEFL